MPFKTYLDTRFRGYDGERSQDFLWLQCRLLKKCRCGIKIFVKSIRTAESRRKK
jgi:hypothetical protein